MLATRDGDEPEASAQRSATATATSLVHPAITSVSTVAAVSASGQAGDPEYRWQHGLYLLKADGSDLRLLTPDVSKAQPIRFSDARWAWSPDGERLAFLGTSGISGGGPLRVTVLNLPKNEATTFDLGNFGYPSGLTWSPDGRYLATAAYDQTQPDPRIAKAIMIDVDSGQFSKVLGSSRETDVVGTPHWSPDSQQLLLPLGVAGNDKKIAVVDLRGQIRRTLGQGGSPVWSPDGRFVAYHGLEEALGVHVVDSETGEGGVRTPNGYYPVWAPSGSHIAYTYPSKIYVSRPDGSDTNALAVGESPAWSPDSTRLAFLREGNLYTINADGTGETRLTASPFPFLAAPVWSPDATSIVVAYWGGDSGIYAVRSDGLDERFLAPGYAPSWSPDGSLIAFTAGMGGTGFSGAYYLVTPGGFHITKIADVTISDNIPPCSGGEGFSWSANGRRVLYEGGAGVYLTELGQDQPRLLRQGGHGPSWSDDGRRLVYSAAGPPRGDCAIYTIDPEGTNEEHELFVGGFAPSVSPDGTKIAFLVNEPPGEGQKYLTMRILIGDAERGDTQIGPQLASDHPFGLLLDWSPDNSRIAYSFDGSIYVVDASDPGQPGKVADGDHPAWSPDGRTLAFAAGDYYDSAIYVMQVDGDSAPRRVTSGSSPDWSPDGSELVFTRARR